MAVKLLPKDFPMLLDRMKEDLPDSIAVYKAIKLISRGLSGYEVYVDSFTAFRAVLVKPDDAGIQMSAAELLQSNGTEIREMQLDADYGELPDGYKVRNLGPEDSDTVLSEVWYKDSDYVKSVKRVLQLGALSVGVEDASGQLVAWTLQHVIGLLGMTYVIPEHRNRKLGKYVTVALAQKMIDKDGFCLAGREDGNSVSVALHEGVGFTNMDAPFCSGLYYEKAYASNLKQLNIPDPTNKNWR